MKTAATLGGNIQVFWDESSGFNGINNATVSGNHNGTYQDYVFDLNSVPAWSDGLARGFRLDRVSGGIGSFEVDYLRLSSSATDSYSYGVDNFSDGSLSQRTKSSPMGSPTESGGVLSGTVTGNGDAFMSRAIIDVDGSNANLVRVGLKVTGVSSSAQIFWTNEDGSYAGARSKTFNITPDGTMRTYEIDLSADPEWDGKTIDGLRFDPVSNPGDSYEIDFIEIVSVPEPSAALLGLFGSLLLLRRRRA